MSDKKAGSWFSTLCENVTGFLSNPVQPSEIFVSSDLASPHHLNSAANGSAMYLREQQIEVKNNGSKSSGPKSRMSETASASHYDAGAGNSSFRYLSPSVLKNFRHVDDLGRKRKHYNSNYHVEEGIGEVRRIDQSSITDIKSKRSRPSNYTEFNHFSNSVNLSSDCIMDTRNMSSNVSTYSERLSSVDYSSVGLNISTPKSYSSSLSTRTKSILQQLEKLPSPAKIVRRMAAVQCNERWKNLVSDSLEKSATGPSGVLSRVNNIPEWSISTPIQYWRQPLYSNSSHVPGAESTEEIGDKCYEKTVDASSSQKSSSPLKQSRCVYRIDNQQFDFDFDVLPSRENDEQQDNSANHVLTSDVPSFNGVFKFSPAIERGPNDADKHDTLPSCAREDIANLNVSDQVDAKQSKADCVSLISPVAIPCELKREDFRNGSPVKAYRDEFEFSESHITMVDREETNDSASQRKSNYIASDLGNISMGVRKTQEPEESKIDSWSCQECFITNAPEVVSCIACSATRDGHKVLGTSALGSQTFQQTKSSLIGVSFGLPVSQASADSRHFVSSNSATTNSDAQYRENTSTSSLNFAVSGLTPTFKLPVNISGFDSRANSELHSSEATHNERFSSDKHTGVPPKLLDSGITKVTDSFLPSLQFVIPSAASTAESGAFITQPSSSIDTPKSSTGNIESVLLDPAGLRAQNHENIALGFAQGGEVPTSTVNLASTSCMSSPFSFGSTVPSTSSSALPTCYFPFPCATSSEEQPAVFGGVPQPAVQLASNLTSQPNAFPFGYSHAASILPTSQSSSSIFGMQSDAPVNFNFRSVTNSTPDTKSSFNQNSEKLQSSDPQMFRRQETVRPFAHNFTTATVPPTAKSNAHSIGTFAFGTAAPNSNGSEGFVFGQAVKPVFNFGGVSTQNFRFQSAENTQSEGLFKFDRNQSSYNTRRILRVRRTKK